MTLATRMKNTAVCYVFILPAVGIFLLFYIVPISHALYLSLHETAAMGQAFYVGLDNYAGLINNDMFWKALRNTLVYTLMFVPSVAVLPMLVALVLNSAVKGRKVFRAIYFVPVVCSVVVVALIWKWIYHPDIGILNYFISLFGLPPQHWLGFDLALSSIAAMQVWKSIGYFMVIYLAGLQSIPYQLYEVARIDGASGWQMFWYITLPMLMHTVLLVVVISTINSFMVFDAIFVMTSGGPGNATMTITFLIYTTAFRSFQVGQATAIGYVLFFIIFVISLMELKVLGGRAER
jgi:multiple sugar transport system permease protein